MKKDLSTVKNSITSVIANNVALINACTTANEIAFTIENLLKANKIGTKASRQLVVRLNHSKSLVESQFIVYNSYAAGTGNAVYNPGKYR